MVRVIIEFFSNLFERTPVGMSREQEQSITQSERRFNIRIRLFMFVRVRQLKTRSGNGMGKTGSFHWRHEPHHISLIITDSSENLVFEQTP